MESVSRNSYNKRPNDPTDTQRRKHQRVPKVRATQEKVWDDGGEIKEGKTDAEQRKTKG